jgi:hypothetical protein
MTDLEAAIEALVLMMFGSLIWSIFLDIRVMAKKLKKALDDYWAPTDECEAVMKAVIAELEGGKPT